MEERLPPADNPPPRFTSTESPETYVVQIPRDQVYRIPPPENARIVENHARNAPQQNKNCCGSRLLCWIFVIIVLLVIVAGIAILVIRAAFYNPKSPEFSVTQIRTKNLALVFPHKNRQARLPEYDVMLHAVNVNERMSVTYRGPGKASLIFKNQNIGKGGVVPQEIEQEPNSPIDIPVILHGSRNPLTSSIKKNLNDTHEKSMYLKIEVPMEIQSWVKSVQKDVTIICDFKVKNSLLDKPKISYQECRTDF